MGDNRISIEEAMTDPEFKHCDENINDETQPLVLRKYLERARSPAHEMMSNDPYPILFATYNGREWKDIVFGDRVRVVMASRLGDVGITKHLDHTHGYTVRCAVADLIDFGDSP